VTPLLRKEGLRERTALASLKELEGTGRSTKFPVHAKKQIDQGFLLDVHQEGRKTDAVLKRGTGTTSPTTK